MPLLINGRTLDDLVFQPLDQRGHLAPAIARREVVDRGDGAPAWTSRLTAGERQIEQVFDVRPDTLADRVTVLDAIRERCHGVCELVASEAPDRRWWGVLESMTPELVDAPYSNPLHLLTLRWRCQDARAEAVEPTLLALSGTPVPCPLGVSASAPVITLFGASTPVVDPVVTVTYGAGARVSTLALTASLGTGDSLVVDCATEQVWRTSGGITTLALSALQSGLFPLLDPADAPVTVSLSATSGTPIGALQYRRRW